MTSTSIDLCISPFYQKNRWLSFVLSQIQDHILPYIMKILKEKFYPVSRQYVIKSTD